MGPTIKTVVIFGVIGAIGVWPLFLLAVALDETPFMPVMYAMLMLVFLGQGSSLEMNCGMSFWTCLPGHLTVASLKYAIVGAMIGYVYCMMRVRTHT
jgi:hypothetical protein